MNDSQATEKQVVEELKNMTEGLLPLVVVTVAALLVAAAVHEKEDA